MINYSPYLFEYEYLTIFANPIGSVDDCDTTDSSYGNLYPISTYLYESYGRLVKRLRHGPFTAVTRVRFSYLSPEKVVVWVLLLLFKKRLCNGYLDLFGVGLTR